LALNITRSSSAWRYQSISGDGSAAEAQAAAMQWRWRQMKRRPLPTGQTDGHPTITQTLHHIL